jgi:hypothetical protein
MGLDMYLYGKKYLSSFNKDEKAKREKIAVIFKEIKFEPIEVTFKIFEWRKANAIHNWFVSNVQDGNDDCKEYSVEWEKLLELLDIINKVLGMAGNTKEKILTNLGDNKLREELLPTTSGFFFGDTEYNEDYTNDLKETKEMIEKLIKQKSKETLDFYYSSSW